MEAEPGTNLPSCRDIFRAIHEGKWLKMNIRKQGPIRSGDQMQILDRDKLDIDPRSRTMKVDGLHLGHSMLLNGQWMLIRLENMTKWHYLALHSILSTEIIKGTYCPENKIAEYLLKILRCIQSVIKIYLTAHNMMNDNAISDIKY